MKAPCEKGSSFDTPSTAAPSSATALSAFSWQVQPSSSAPENAAGTKASTRGRGIAARSILRREEEGVGGA